ncbi:MAG: D-hexose-6-phosphate mutarotase, partial [Phycisphaerae bacterium]|nr:D-hexose-6-phosphate mutarotase [Phycisphaerae bacterium]
MELVMDLDALNRQFGIERLVRIESGEGGFPRIVVTSPLAEAEMYLYGAHVTRFTPQGEGPVLWMSNAAVFKAGKAIRGGVPICFP